MQKKNESRKLNNRGFSLLELLIAVMILAVVSIPLIRSLGTVASTNGRAKILMYSTECAENAMEYVERMTVEELVDLLGPVSGKVTKDDGSAVEDSYVFNVTNAAVVDGKLPPGYRLEVKLDSSKFTNNNALNISDVKSMSMADTAVYDMSPLYDGGVHQKFADWNKAAREMNPGGYMTADAAFFQKKLVREITVNIEKHGESAPKEDGSTVELVTVSLDILFKFKSEGDGWKYLLADQQTYQEKTIEIFNNLSTEIPLAGIYLFYQPRAVATQAGNKDVIKIYNPDNIKTNLFLAAQPGDIAQASESLYYSSMTGPDVTIYEEDAKDASRAAITLFTNLCETAPYTEKEADGLIQCNLSYENADGYGGSQDGQTAAKVLNCRNLDGKTLIAEDTKTRIYKVTVTVYQGDTKIVELDGTKLE